MCPRALHLLHFVLIFFYFSIYFSKFNLERKGLNLIAGSYDVTV